MSALQNAQRWFKTHRTETLAAGGAGVVGFALYKRHQNGGADPAPPGGGGTDLGASYGDPGSAGSTLSDVDAALLDADLTGIQGTLDGIRRTIGKIGRGGKGKG